MNIFAVDSSSSAASAAILRDGVVVAESYCDVGLTHSETLMPLCDETFRRAGLTPRDMDYFAVSSGPGSFTGLRIGAGVLKGMAFAVSKPCVAVPTLEALAYGALGCERTIAAVCDARRGRVYAALFSQDGERVGRLCADEAMSIEQLGERIAGKRVLFIGDAAGLCYNELRDKADCLVAAVNVRLVRASDVALAALSHIDAGDICTANELAPDYLAPSQAERNYKEKHQ